jgi:chemotaxis protein methyltransferase CheR
MHGPRAQATDEIELTLLVDGVRRRWEVDLRDFPRPVLRDRVARFLRAEGLATISALQERVLHDGAAFDRFLVSLSLRTSTMFDDVPFHLAFRRTVIPRLRTYPSCNVWLAGCGTGEEAWAIAITAREEGILPRLRIYATDPSAESLETARAGVVPSASLRLAERNHRRSGGSGALGSHWLVGEGSALLDPELRAAIVFSEHDFASDGSFNEFQLVAVRRGLAGLDPDAAPRAWDVLRESLVPFGFLAAAAGEADSATRAGFELVDPSVPLFRKVS